MSNINESIADDEVYTYFRTLLMHLSKPPDLSRLGEIEEENEEKKREMLE